MFGVSEVWRKRPSVNDLTISDECADSEAEDSAVYYY